jgi:hypothetical protein
VRVKFEDDVSYLGTKADAVAASGDDVTAARAELVAAWMNYAEYEKSTVR